MPKKNDQRVPVQSYLGYLLSMANHQPSLPLKIHLIDRTRRADPPDYGIEMHAACGEVIDLENLVVYEPPLTAALARRASACRKCASLHPSRFERIARSIP